MQTKQLVAVFLRRFVVLCKRKVNPRNFINAVTLARTAVNRAVQTYKYKDTGVQFMINETFGQRFQRLRKNAGLTQEDVATKLNITAQAVSKWENDVSAPDISVLVELSDILNVTLNELLGKQTETQFVPAEQRKDINDMSFRIKVLSKDGDKVNVNIPLALAKIFVDSGADMPQINGKDVLNNIDFNQLFDLVERGVVGKIVEVESKDGDFVEVWVE